ncbi:MAG: dipeptide epimerase [Pedobacter sp.]|nr:MAG: dipeptide epimerase [Pedobacter sp.]
MKISCKEFELILKHPFSIAKFTRTSTPLMLLKLESNGQIGYGEASMVPYMGESYASAQEFLNAVEWNRFSFPFNFEEIHAYLDDLKPGNPAIKAAIDIALHDLTGKLLGKPLYEMIGSNPEKMPVTSYTVGIDTPEVIREKLADAQNFKVIKVKLGRDNDQEIIQTIRAVTDLPLYVDANQGWSDRKKAIDLCYWLHDQGVLLIEQPMDKLDLDGNAWLTQRSPIPIIADEAMQRIGDLAALKGAYHGINIKLMKTAGIYEAKQTIDKARSLGMKILIGCMSETSIATLAGIALAPQCDWADLDGPWLTVNNPFAQPILENGKYVMPNTPGLGLSGMKEDLF